MASRRPAAAAGGNGDPPSARVLGALRARSGRKAVDLAQELGLERRTVNGLLHGELRGRVRQDSAYRWYPVDGAVTPAGAENRPARPDTPLARLCRYYLECLSGDYDSGVSVFAASDRGSLEYEQLPELPNVEGAANVLLQEAPLALCRRALTQRPPLNAFLGYPVRLREHHGRSGWRGFFVEPVFLIRLDLEAGPGGEPVFADDLPGFNFKALAALTGGETGSLLEEIAALNTELGLDSSGVAAPEFDEVVERLRAIRPEWDWKEDTDPEALSSGLPLAELTEPGIYNRAVVVLAERSAFTQGLESELKKLAELGEDKVRGTALAGWLEGGEPVAQTEEQPDGAPALLEVLPLNSEQRAAVRCAFASPLSVITGPPGTGKSQVVTGLLINAARSGMRVLFASKNNKAVDVVEQRVNGFGPRPVVLRTGSNEHQEGLVEYLLGLLGATCTPEDEAEYEDEREAHQRLSHEIDEIDRAADAVVVQRNRVDRLDRRISKQREALGEEVYCEARELNLDAARGIHGALSRAVGDCDPQGRGALARLVRRLGERRRQRALDSALNAAAPVVARLGLGAPPATDAAGRLPELRGFLETLAGRVEWAEYVQRYAEALEALQAKPSLEELARREAALADRLAQASEAVWRAWLRLQPARLSREDRRMVGDYAALLQTVVHAGGRNVPRETWRRFYQLFPHIAGMFPCWAVTSLSARRLPFDAGFFDLLVIDEASQCDIASALPLLYRAKRAVVIGDPKQLRHISSIPPDRDQRLMDKHGVLDTHAGWAYSVTSLFSLASSICAGADLTTLRDHHRSHADIIEFSNRFFYDGRLRVATRHDRLKGPGSREPAVRWTHVVGRVNRPAGGGAVNEAEARAVAEALADLVLARGYEGSIGVVTPFRAQVNLLRRMVERDEPLARALHDRDFLVDSVHRFQGDERDAMLFSPVVSQGMTPGALGFLRSNGNLFNVAITRARGLLQVVGDRNAAKASGVDYLAAFAEHVEGVGRQHGERAVETSLGPGYPTVSHPERVSDWERVLYCALYEAGVRPIPQYDVEQYTLDFAVFDGERRLNVEVDGERWHKDWSGELCRRDRLRNQRMIELGWEVKRFWVYEVRDDLAACVDWVRRWCEGEAGAVAVAGARPGPRHTSPPLR